MFAQHKQHYFLWSRGSQEPRLQIQYLYIEDPGDEAVSSILCRVAPTQTELGLNEKLMMQKPSRNNPVENGLSDHNFPFEV